MNAIDRTLIELTARLSMMEKLVSDVCLNMICALPDPIANFESFQAKTIDSLRRSRMPPGTDAADADIGLEIQAKTISFARRYFAALREDIDRTV